MTLATTLLAPLDAAPHAAQVALGAAASVAAGLVVWRYVAVSTLVLAHLHDFLAIAIWWGWRRHDDRWRFLPLLAFAGGVALITSGATEGLLVGALEPSFPHPD